MLSTGPNLLQFSTLDALNYSTPVCSKKSLSFKGRILNFYLEKQFIVHHFKTFELARDANLEQEEDFVDPVLLASIVHLDFTFIS